jgi:hypothetical protein
MKSIISISLLLCLFSCSTLIHSGRSPANETGRSCIELTQNILLSDTYDHDLNKVLVDKKLVTFKEKIILVHYPSLNWINKVKTSFTNSLRNWNSTRYPAFYIFSDEDIIPTATTYAVNIEKIISRQLTADDTESIKAAQAVEDWTKVFEGYKLEMDQLLEQRISLQYNINLLKELKLGPNETRDIQLSVKRGGVLQDEIITLRAEDKNLGFTIKKLKNEMTTLDELFGSNGKIKERIIRQAMLKDILTIVHRELEHALKNSTAPSAEAIAELSRITMMLKNSEDMASSYGTFKITNKVFIREMASALKLDSAYQKVTTPVSNIRSILSNYFTSAKTEVENLVPDRVQFPDLNSTSTDNNAFVAPTVDSTAAPTETQKVGFLQGTFASISNVSAKGVVTAAVVVVGGIELNRYFSVKTNSTTEVKNDSKQTAILENTKKKIQDKTNSISTMVEVQINDLKN